MKKHYCYQYAPPTSYTLFRLVVVILLLLLPVSLFLYGYLTSPTVDNGSMHEIREERAHSSPQIVNESHVVGYAVSPSEETLWYGLCSRMLGEIHNVEDIQQRFTTAYNGGVNISRISTLKEPLLAYVSYKKEGQVHWTHQRITLRSGERIAVSTTGESYRLSCCNKIAYRRPSGALGSPWIPSLGGYIDPPEYALGGAPPLPVRRTPLSYVPRFMSTSNKPYVLPEVLILPPFFMPSSFPEITFSSHTFPPLTMLPFSIPEEPTVSELPMIPEYFPREPGSLSPVLMPFENPSTEVPPVSPKAYVPESQTYILLGSGLLLYFLLRSR